MRAVTIRARIVGNVVRERAGTWEVLQSLKGGLDYIPTTIEKNCRLIREVINPGLHFRTFSLVQWEGGLWREADWQGHLYIGRNKN